MHKTNHLREWLADPRFELIIGRPAAIRVEVLAHVLSGTGTLAAIARKHGLCKAAMTRHLRRVRQALKPASPPAVNH